MLTCWVGGFVNVSYLREVSTDDRRRYRMASFLCSNLRRDCFFWSWTTSAECHDFYKTFSKLFQVVRPSSWFFLLLLTLLVQSQASFESQYRRVHILKHVLLTSWTIVLLNWFFNIFFGNDLFCRICIKITGLLDANPECHNVPHHTRNLCNLE